MERCLLAVSLLLVATVVAATPRRVPVDPNIDWKIVGGSDAPEGWYPYQVSLWRQGSRSHTCGGVIIHPEWVVTAAQCVEGVPEPTLQIRVGSNRLSGGATSYSIIAKYMHEGYNSETLLHNVAILRVHTIEFTNKVSAAVLETALIGGNYKCIFSGWGFTSSPPGDYSDKLQHITLKTTTVQYCQEKITNRPVDSSHICTFTSYGQGLCAGDTGGPLVTIVNGIMKVIGIASGSDYPCAIGSPDVFSRVSYYYSWFKVKCNDCI